MTKIWINKEKGDDSLIGIGNNKIYKANPKEQKLTQFVDLIETDSAHIDILSIPFSYIRSIQFQIGKKYIKVCFGQESEEHLKISDEDKRVEIFKYFKENVPSMEFRSKKYTVIEAIKKPLIALVVALLLYLWTMHYVLEIASGTQYELIGNGGSISGIVFSLAQLGLVKVNIIFAALFSIGIFSAVKKGKKPAEILEIYKK
jgi:hypothetical protein